MGRWPRIEWLRAASMVVCAFACAAPVRADVLILTMGSGTREMRCVILEESPTAYTVRIKIGKSTIPKARVAGMQRQSAEQNAALIAGWDAAKQRNPRGSLPPPAVEGPIPPPEDTDVRVVDVPALIEQYSLAQLQGGVEFDARCPKDSPWCEGYVVAVNKLFRTEIGLRRGDRVLGVNGQRIPNGAGIDGYLAQVMQRAMNGSHTSLHLIRGGTRLDLRLNPPR